MFKKTVLFLGITLMFNFHLLADGSESFLSTLSKTNLDYETEHIFVTNFTENNTLSIFKHQNIIETIPKLKAIHIATNTTNQTITNKST